MLWHPQARGKAAEQRGEKETGVTAPGAEDLDPRDADRCPRSFKGLGFQHMGLSPSPSDSYCRDPLLPSGSGRRRELVLLAHLENSSAMGHSQLLCNP